MLKLQNVFVPILVVATLSLAQTSSSNSNSLQLEAEAIQAHFANAGLVPEPIAAFQPSAILNVSYEGVGPIQPGQNLTSDEVKPTPSLTLTPVNSSVSLSGSYTVIMADAGIVGADQSQGQTRHWLANGATVSNNVVSFANSLNITDYAGPFPAEGSGAHRYAILLYSQPQSFNPPSDLSSPNQPVGTFDLNQYLKSANFDTLVAANYLTVERGVSTVTVSATSAVVTSTLPAAKPQSTSGTSSSATSSSTQTPASGNAAIAVQVAGSALTGFAVVAGLSLLA